MAKTKPKNKQSKEDRKAAQKRTSGRSNAPKANMAVSTADLLAQAAALLQNGDIEGSVKPAKKALKSLNVESPEALPALNLLGEIHVELGDIDSARQYFQQAAAIDEDGSVPEELGGGAEKFLWLAQLSEEGGQDSVDWFEKGAMSLRVQIDALLASGKLDAEGEAAMAEKTRKLAVALCGVVEVYMTDLSWEEDAEHKCETLVTEATLVAPQFAEPLQTLANVRISQSRLEDAKAALKRSLDLWKDLPPGDTVVPDFPTRVSLARLLMEADMEVEAIDVLERLVGEDDSSVEVWYLGGWGLYILGEKQKNGEVKVENGDGESWRVSWISSRQWLDQSLRLYKQQDYEDERLGEHAEELQALINKELGGVSAEEEEEGDIWEDEGSEEDKEMIGA
ncbi:TPR domain-containing protein [Drepanopeziza brunnea f. sp. 'multigermtubi' MB_m1]|uniref:TPR domain-containing protein n=2 Tax=Drepanopeziza brunnea f. sp. 'multigermtubi' TaxID=698441 RepID=K1WTP4_MARBU|nr:TPR domain-containing protein [Drepanopeziza brunnea f. sp. 'multigermtubi' MB_m1]EKD15822.1 TPR domain-containing protein [Drepanopeziza brunnea f. sp. 'multigermtubi' MB_m1]